jgi:hypothetical protein
MTRGESRVVRERRDSPNVRAYARLRNALIGELQGLPDLRIFRRAV